MVDKGKKTSIFVKLVLVQIFWAGTFVASEIALHEQPAATTAAVRFVVTTACYVALCSVFARQREPLWPRLWDLSVRDWAVLAAMGFFGVAAYTILLHLGLRHSTAANAALLIPTTQPVFTAVLGAAVLGERPPAKLWLGLGLGLVGAILVISHDAGGSVALSSNVLIVLSAFAFSCYAVSAKFSPDRLDSLETTTLSFGFGMVFLLPLPFLLGEPIDLANASTTFWLSIAYLAIFATLLAYLWWNQAVKALGASRTGIFTFLMPPFAVALAALVLGHAPAAQQILGGCLALGGVALATFDRSLLSRQASR